MTRRLSQLDHHGKQRASSAAVDRPYDPAAGRGKRDVGVGLVDEERLAESDAVALADQHARLESDVVGAE